MFLSKILLDGQCLPNGKVSLASILFATTTTTTIIIIIIIRQLPDTISEQIPTDINPRDICLLRWSMARQQRTQRASCNVSRKLIGLGYGKMSQLSFGDNSRFIVLQSQIVTRQNTKNGSSPHTNVHSDLPFRCSYRLWYQHITKWQQKGER